MKKIKKVNNFSYHILKTLINNILNFNFSSFKKNFIFLIWFEHIALSHKSLEFLFLHK